MNFLATRSLISAAKATILLSLLGAMIAISQSSLIAADDIIPAALAIDFLITLPVAYLLAIRKTSVPKITVAPVFFVSYLIASSALPNGVALMSLAGGLAVPAVELGVLGYLAYRIYRTRKAFRDEVHAGSDIMERLRSAFVRELKPPIVARAAAFEVAIFAFAFFKWRRPIGGGFSYHRTNGSSLILIVFPFLLVAETVVLHFLLADLSEILAWMATALSIYFVIQIAAHLKALYLRPIVINESTLLLRCGILGDAVIPRDAIRSVTAANGVSRASSFALLPLGGCSQPNVVIDLAEPVTIYGVYGMTKYVDQLLICVDDPESFIESVKL